MGIKRFTLLILLLFVVLQTSCVWDRNNGKRPIDQPGTRWVSSDPYIWFEVTDPNDRTCYGEIELDGENIKIEVFFAYDRRMWVKTSKAAGTMVFGGECEFSDNILVVLLSKEKPADQHPLYYLDDSIETITFYRED